MSNASAAPQRRIKLIANPISGRGSARALARSIATELNRRGYLVELNETSKQGDARDLASHVEGFDRVICIGGDGTMSEVINGLPENAPPLGAIPSGTGNAYAKELHLPWTVSNLAQVIDAGRVVAWDVGLNRTTGRKFMMFAGAGFQAEVIRHFQQHRRGPVFIGEYLIWGSHVARTYRLPKVTVELDGKIVSRDGPWVEIFNISHYGGPLRLAMHASPSDGLFDVMIFQGRRLRDIARLLSAAFYSYMMGSPYRLKDMHFIKGRRVRLFSDEAVPIHMDGDFTGYLPVELEILPGRVKLLAPGAGRKEEA